MLVIIKICRGQEQNTMGRARRPQGPGPCRPPLWLRPCVQLRCESCGEVSQKETCLCLEQNFVIPKKRQINFKERVAFVYPSKNPNHPFNRRTPFPQTPGLYNCMQKCKLCSREGTIVMIPGVGRPLSKDDCDGEKYVPLMAFECQGLQPVDYSFVGPMWTVKTTSGKIFEDVDLSEGRWENYEERVMICDLKSQFEVVKAWKYREVLKPDKKKSSEEKAVAAI